MSGVVTKSSNIFENGTTVYVPHSHSLPCSMLKLRDGGHVITRIVIAIHCGHTVKSTAPPLLPVSDSDTIVLSYTPPASEAQETAETAPLGTESMDTDQGAPSNQATSPTTVTQTVVILSTVNTVTAASLVQISSTSGNAVATASTAHIDSTLGDTVATTHINPTTRTTVATVPTTHFNPTTRVTVGTAPTAHTNLTPGDSVFTIPIANISSNPENSASTPTAFTSRILVGSVVGIVVGVLIFVSVLVIFVCRRHRRTIALAEAARPFPFRLRGRGLQTLPQRQHHRKTEEHPIAEPTPAAPESPSGAPPSYTSRMEARLAPSARVGMKVRT